MKAFADLYELPEDDRIRVIGHTAEQGQRVGFVVEDDTKADRYVEKLTTQFHIEVVKRGAGPVENTILIIVERKADA